MRTYLPITAALAVVAIASDAPIAKTSIGMTWTATFPTGTNITGSVLGAGSPDGSGSNFQVAMSDLPEGSNITYVITTGKIRGRGNDCASAGGVLDPFTGATGAPQCSEDNMAACRVGDLSGKHGNAVLSTGGAGTGYFSANFIDQFLSTEKDSDAFFGDKSVVVSDSATGAPLTCANFISSEKQHANDDKNKSETASSTSGMASATSGSASEATESASATESGNAASRTAAVGFGAAAGAAGLAALLL